MRSSKHTTLVFLYTILISAWYLSWLKLGDGTWWLTMLNRVVPYLFLPAVLFLVWLLLSRRFKLVPFLLLPVYIFSSLYHPYLLPKFTAPEADTVDISVMTYNVLFSNKKYDAVANVILTHQPDMVALQEVQPGMMVALQALLADQYPYSSMGDRHDYGTTAIFSRYPFTDTYVLDLEADRPAVVASIEVGEKEVTFVTAHLQAYGLWWVGWENIPQAVVQRTKDQNRQAQILLDALSRENGMVIIGCDCNSKETSSSYRMLSEDLENASRRVGRLAIGNTFENLRQDINLQHIDYVWYRGALDPITAFRVLDRGGSDHYPVLVDFNLR